MKPNLERKMFYGFNALFALFLLLAFCPRSAAAAWPYVTGGLTGNYTQKVLKTLKFEYEEGIFYPYVFGYGDFPVTVPVVSGYNADGTAIFTKGTLFSVDPKRFSYGTKFIYARLATGQVIPFAKYESSDSDRGIVGAEADSANIYLVRVMNDANYRYFAFLKLTPIKVKP